MQILDYMGIHYGWNNRKEIPRFCFLIDSEPHYEVDLGSSVLFLVRLDRTKGRLRSLGGLETKSVGLHNSM